MERGEERRREEMRGEVRIEVDSRGEEKRGEEPARREKLVR